MNGQYVELNTLTREQLEHELKHKDMLVSELTVMIGKLQVSLTSEVLKNQAKDRQMMDYLKQQGEAAEEAESEKKKA